MRALLFSIMILLLALPTVVAETVLYEGWHFSGDVFAVGEQEYSVEQDPDPDMRDRNIMKLSVDDNLYLLRLHGCTETNTHRYCFESSGYQDYLDAGGSVNRSMPEFEKKPYAKYDGGEKWWGLKLKVISLLPEVGASIVIEDTNIKLDETVKATIILKNEGLKDAQNAEFSLVLPPAYELQSGEHTRKGNKVYWQGIIVSGKEKRIDFKFKPRNYESATLSGALNYTYNEKEYSIDAKVSVSMADPYTIQITFPSDAQAIHEESEYIITLTNNEENEIVDVRSLIITTPSGVNLISPSRDFIREIGRVRWKGKLAAEQTKKLSFALAAPFTGEYPFKTIAQIDIDGRSFSFEEEHTLKVETDRLDPEFSVREENVVSRKPFNIRLFLKNNNERNNYYDVSYKIQSSDYPGEEYTLDKIQYGTSDIFWQKEYIAPFSEEEKTIIFNATGNYRTLSGEQFSFETSKSIRIKPAEERYYSVSYDVPQSLVVGESDFITIYVKNEQEIFASIDVEDEPLGEVLQGVNHASISLDAGEEREAYTYKLKVSEEQEGDQLILITNVKDLLTGTVESFTKNITLKQPEHVDNSTSALEKNETELPSKPIAAPIIKKEVEKKSLTQKLFSLIDSFFALFS